jgi:hypothetical protein
MDEQRSRSPWRSGAGVAACLVLGWIGVVREGPVPLLSLVDLGFHELGHMVTAALPTMATAMAGSVAQVLVPVGLAVYFLVRSRDLVAVGLCLAWGGTSAQNVAVYVADAPYQLLPLIGGEHDWAYILAMMGELDSAAGIASGIRMLAFVLVIGGIAFCAWGLLRRPPVPRTWGPAEATGHTFTAWEG